MLETLYSAALSHNADIVSCKAKQYWEIDETYSEMFPTPSGIYTAHQYLELLFTEKTSSHVWLRLLKRELFNQIQFPRGVTFEDVLTLPLLIKNSNRIVQLPNTLYFYRQRNSKTSITGSKPTNLKGFILCLGKIEGEFTYSPEQSFLFRRFAYKVLFFIAFNVSHYSNNFQESKRDLTSIRRYLKFYLLSSDIRKTNKDIKTNSLLYLLLLKVNPRLIFIAHKLVFYKRFR